MAGEPTDRTLRNVSDGFRSLILVHEGSIRLDPGEIVTVSMSQLEYDDALATGWFEALTPVVEAEPEPAPAPRDPLDHDGDGKKGGSKPRASRG